MNIVINNSKFIFRGNELELSIKGIDGLFSEYQTPSEMVVVADELIANIDETFIKIFNNRIQKEFPWQSIERVIEIDDYEIRKEQFYQLYTEYIQRNINPPKWIINGSNSLEDMSIVYKNGINANLLINYIMYRRDQLYLLMKFKKIDIMDWPILDMNFYSIKLLLMNSIKCEKLYWKNYESSLVELFSSLVRNGFISCYVVGLDSNGRHNFTKMQWNHLNDHFRIKNSRYDTEDKKLDQKKLKNEFSVKSFIKNDDSIIDIGLKLANSCFIWEKKEIHFAYLFDQLTISGLLVNTLKSDKQISVDTSHPEDVPRPHWESIVRHFVIVKKTSIQKMDAKRLANQLSNYNKRIKDKEKIVYKEINGIVKDLFEFQKSILKSK